MAAMFTISQYVPMILCTGRLDSNVLGAGGKVCETADVPGSFKSEVWDHLSPPPAGGKEEDVTDRGGTMCNTARMRLPHFRCTSLLHVLQHLSVALHMCTWF